MTLSDDGQPDSPSDDEMLPCKRYCDFMNQNIGCGRMFPRRDLLNASEKGIQPGDPMYFGICTECWTTQYSDSEEDPPHHLRGPWDEDDDDNPGAATAGTSDSDGYTSTSTLELHLRFEQKPAVKKKTLQQREDSDGDSSHPMWRQFYSDAMVKKKPAVKKKKTLFRCAKSAPACLKKPVCLGPKGAAVKKKPAEELQLEHGLPLILPRTMSSPLSDADEPSDDEPMQASSSNNPITQKQKPSQPCKLLRKPCVLKKMPASMQASTSESELSSPIKHRKTAKKPASTSRTSAAQTCITRFFCVSTFGPRTSVGQ